MELGHTRCPYAPSYRTSSPGSARSREGSTRTPPQSSMASSSPAPVRPDTPGLESRHRSGASQPWRRRLRHSGLTLADTQPAAGTLIRSCRARAMTSRRAARLVPQICSRPRLLLGLSSGSSTAKGRSSSETALDIFGPRDPTLLPPCPRYVVAEPESQVGAIHEGESIGQRTGLTVALREQVDEEFTESRSMPCGSSCLRDEDCCTEPPMLRGVGHFGVYRDPVLWGGRFRLPPPTVCSVAVRALAHRRPPVVDPLALFLRGRRRVERGSGVSCGHRASGECQCSEVGEGGDRGLASHDSHLVWVCCVCGCEFDAHLRSPNRGTRRS